MNTLEEFLTVVRDELGLPVDAADADRDLTQIPGWDSVHLLWLLSAIERRTGRSVSLPDLLEAQDLASLYAAAVGA